MTFPMTVFHGINLNDWKTNPILGPGFGCGPPSIRISPESGRIRPSISFRRVVFPDPDGPITTTNSFSWTLIDRPLITSSVTNPLPFLRGKDLARSRSSTFFESNPSPTRLSSSGAQEWRPRGQALEGND